MKLFLNAGVFFLLVQFCGAAFAQGGPPLRTDDPETPGNRNWEINLGATSEVLRTATDAELPIADFNYGWGNRTQIKLEIPLLVRFSHGTIQSEAGDGKVGVKWRFLGQDKHGVNVSTYPQMSFNVPGPQRLVDSGMQLLLPLEISRSFGRFSADAEFGFNLQQTGGNELILGLAMGYEATKRLELLGELHSVPTVSFSANESVFQIGGRQKLSQHYVLLFAAGRGIPGSTGNQPGFIAYAGLQILLGPAKH
ncbi:MAG TPA: hypothetical protein VF532_15660 [Candidatus Angelobacter sp.]